MSDQTWTGSLPEQLAQVARQGPQRIALDFCSQKLDFQGLIQQAEGLARVLTDAPAGPVALLLPTGPEAVIAMVAALRAGRVYCLLDTAFPPQRLQDMLAEVGPQLVLTTTEGSPCWATGSARGCRA